ncbi:unnamed protein product, partial [marine sediment metagenome]
GLLSGFMDQVRQDSELDLQVIATCMHLSPEFGLTYRQIERDGFHIDRKVHMLLSSDTPVGVAKSMGLGLIGFADALDELRPNLLVVLGDRFEVLAAASAALVARIPIAHIHGGEVTVGAFDDAIRHAVSKMAHLHFASTEAYRRRLIQMGEVPDRVFNVGAPGVEIIRRLALLSREDLATAIHFDLASDYVLVTFHPATAEDTPSDAQCGELLAALDACGDLRVIFTRANADPGGRAINGLIDAYVERSGERTVVFTSMGQVR